MTSLYGELPSDNLFTLDQFTTGMYLNTIRVMRERDWGQWYSGDYSSLFPPATEFNGMNLWVPDGKPAADHAVRIPVFELASDFYTEVVLGERPIISGSQAVENWVKEYGAKLWRTVRRAVLGWAIYGRLVLVAHEDGSMEAVDHPEYYRIGRIYDRDEEVAHVITYRYYKPTTLAEAQQEGIVLMQPNEVRVIKFAMPSNDYPEGVNTVQTFHLSGGQIGNPITGEEPAGLTYLFTAGRADSWYGKAAALAAAYIGEVSGQRATINRARNAPTALPQSALDAMRGDADERAAITVWQDFNKLVHPVVGFNADVDGQMDARGLLPSLPIVEGYDMIQVLEKLVFIVTGLPPSAFGYDIGMSTSGVARERAQDASVARVRDLREELASGLPMLMQAIGAPAGREISVSWQLPPFANRLEYVEQMRQNYNDKAITLDEYRKALGFGPMDPQQVQQEREMMADPNEEEDDAA